MHEFSVDLETIVIMHHQIFSSNSKVKFSFYKGNKIPRKKMDLDTKMHLPQNDQNADTYDFVAFTRRNLVSYTYGRLITITLSTKHLILITIK